MKGNQYNRSFARRLTRWVILALLIMMGLMALFVYDFGKSILVEGTAEGVSTTVRSYEYSINNVMSTVRVAVENSIFDIERNLNQPAQLQAIMERIVATNPKMRSCGISFIANYFPQKGRAYCPYAWRKDSVTVVGQPIEDAQADYLEKAWFKEAVAADSAYWSKPFFDIHDGETPLVAYQVPVHDAKGRVVAIIGADLSLHFMTHLLEEGDAHYSERLMTIPVYGGNTSNSFVLSNDGTYLTHPDKPRILRGNLFDHIKDADIPGIAQSIKKKMSDGEKSHNEVYHEVLVNRTKTYLFYSPLEGTDWILVVTIPYQSISIVGVLFGFTMLLIFIIVLLVTLFICQMAIQRASKPLKQLAATADMVADGQFDAPLPDINSHDEIHLLRDTFEHMQSSLSTYIEELKSTTAAKASMESELKIASDIQMSMVPKTFPAFPDRHDIDIFGWVRPAKAVGGDLYDFFIQDDQLFFCIGDVSGKGVPASLVMAVTRSLFRNIAAYIKSPDQIMAALNDALCDNNDAGMFVTLFLGVLDLSTGQVKYSNAGHNPPLLLTDDAVCVVSCDANVSAGVMTGWQFSMQHLCLKAGDNLFLYTDGLNEAEDIHYSQFGMERMIQVASESSRQPKILIEAMTAAVEQFVGEAEQNDDLTMLAIQYIHS